MSPHEMATAARTALYRPGAGWLRLGIGGMKKRKVALAPLLTPLDEAAKDTAITSIIGRG
jgi:hypothetical protein